MDKQCAQGKSNKTIECPDYSCYCLVGIDSNGYTHRSCSSMKLYDERTYPNGYEICFGDYCNDQIFPENRLLCYQQNAPDTKPTPCKIYSKDEDCIVYVDEGDIFVCGLVCLLIDLCDFGFFAKRQVHYGCMSDLKFKAKFDASTGIRKKCSTDTCNSFMKDDISHSSVKFGARPTIAMTVNFGLIVCIRHMI